MRRLWRAAAAFALLAIGLALYQVIAPRSHMLFPPRASNGIDYVLFAHVPEPCRNGGCQAIYVLDGLAWLPTVARRADELSERGQIPPFVIVGIAYGDAFDTGDLRKHDFTPAFDRTPNQTGGADAFLGVLRNELIPYAESHLPIEAGGRGLVGHSYAGLFAAYCLARAPTLFDHYLIMSPALWFDDGKIFHTNIEPTSAPRAVFLAADTPRGEARSAMASDTLRLSDQLSAQPNLQASRALIFGTTHNSMVDPAIRRGLVALYGSDAS